MPRKKDGRNVTLIYLRRIYDSNILSDLPDGKWLGMVPTGEIHKWQLGSRCQTLVAEKAHEWACSKENYAETSLVAQWLRILLPMQGTQVWALVREDPTCHRATKPMSHNYWAWALEPVSHNYWARVPQLLKPTSLEPVLRNKRSHRNEKPAHRIKEKVHAQQWRPNSAKKKKN